MTRLLPTGPRRLQARLREERALELRIAGRTPSAIAAEVGVSRQHVHRILTKVLGELSETTLERAAELREIQAQRIEARIADLMPRAEAGDAAADRVLVRLMERQARLLGLDLQREEVVPEVHIEVLFETPDRRSGGDTAEPPLDADFEEVPAASLEAHTEGEAPR